MSSSDFPGAPPEQGSAIVRVKAFDSSTSPVDALQHLLDAAEQRNAEDSPSGAARHFRFGLSG